MVFKEEILSDRLLLQYSVNTDLIENIVIIALSIVCLNIKQ